jgi:predicted aconitase
VEIVWRFTFTRSPHPVPRSKLGASYLTSGFVAPFLVYVGRAAVIAVWLRESRYPRCTADVVTAELARPERERSVIGRFAADQLKTAGWRP